MKRERGRGESKICFRGKVEVGGGEGGGDVENDVMNKWDYLNEVTFLCNWFMINIWRMLNIVKVITLFLLLEDIEPLNGQSRKGEPK